MLMTRNQTRWFKVLEGTLLGNIQLRKYPLKNIHARTASTTLDLRQKMLLIPETISPRKPGEKRRSILTGRLWASL
ncbi:hypothetical protein ASPCAL09308 [Aspergillus calidoustus]|uniref:Uncharacterized protein n=1 Tax=Aspergillus calidoustus TaxID=454130 RepID=A0A0U5GV46_ASPCI|nr:hypothetical protein ASPCAL09308 [Aspergillus calidoustus]